jgi:hypothetical protein
MRDVRHMVNIVAHHLLVMTRTGHGLCTLRHSPGFLRGRHLAGGQTRRLCGAGYGDAVGDDEARAALRPCSGTRTRDRTVQRGTPAATLWGSESNISVRDRTGTV